MRISDWSSDVCSSDLIKKTDKKATYDWDKGVATWSGDVKPERAGPVKLQPGDVDALLLNLELARDVQAGEPLDYRMVDDGRVKSMTYKVVGKDEITIAGKAHTATKVSNRDGAKETIARLVDGMPMPVRILQRKDGKDELDLRIPSVQSGKIKGVSSAARPPDMAPFPGGDAVPEARLSQSRRGE